MVVQKMTGSQDVTETVSYFGKRIPGSTSLCSWLTKTKFERKNTDKINATIVAAKAQPLFGFTAGGKPEWALLGNCEC